MTPAGATRTAAKHTAATRARAFRTLALTEALERFAYCGMQILLVLYLARTGHAAGIVGMDRLAPLLGGGDAGARAVRLYGIFAAATYLAPLLGTLVADRIGRRETMAIGCGLMTAGHALMIGERWLLVGLALLAAGAGCTLANRPAMIGDLYDDDHERVAAFARYVAATNTGVIAAPLVCGTLGERWGWAWGFGAAAAGMALGGLVYIAGWRSLPARPSTDAAVDPGGSAWRIPAIWLMLIPFVIVTTVLNQAYATVPIWATDRLDRVVTGWSMPVTSLIAYDGVATLLFIALTTRLWAMLARRGREPGDRAKLAIGCLVVAAAYAVLAGVSTAVPAPLVGALAFYTVLDASAAWIEPPLAALIARLSPAGRSGAAMAMMKAATAVAALLLGWSGGWYAPLGPVRFWAVNALAALAAAVLVAAVMVSVRRRRSPPTPRPRRPD